ncbi:hypothetical protein CYMTET_11656 [Cymbomonas tetramitiformis]|uniref:Uncharacterized protein n=1 Tax=Cymbomonas tetramitiformis TaxID=36881 RepID=A0AAE0GN94_9CHLO|nr:hypothetical protein CYMTET_11656 [Cymbomonas tetramitiformis]
MVRCALLVPQCPSCAVPNIQPSIRKAKTKDYPKVHQEKLTLTHIWNVIRPLLAVQFGESGRMCELAMESKHFRDKTFEIFCASSHARVCEKFGQICVLGGPRVEGDRTRWQRKLTELLDLEDEDALRVYLVACYYVENEAIIDLMLEFRTDPTVLGKVQKREKGSARENLLWHTSIPASSATVTASTPTCTDASILAGTVSTPVCTDVSSSAEAAPFSAVELHSSEHCILENCDVEDRSETLAGSPINDLPIGALDPWEELMASVCTEALLMDDLSTTSSEEFSLEELGELPEL